MNVQGFAYHVRSEHNMWHYYSYLVCLQDTTVNDLSAVDLFVKRSVCAIQSLAIQLQGLWSVEYEFDVVAF